MTVVVLIVLIEMFKVNQEINRYHMEKQQVTPADYTVEIKGYHEEPLLDQVDKLIHDLLRAKVRSQSKNRLKTGSKYAKYTFCLT
jgi:hypothetical protein